MEARQPPSSHDAERSVLGAMLIDKRCIPIVLGLLSPTDFYWGAHERIYRAIVDVYRDDGEVDVVLVTDYLDHVDNPDDYDYGLVAEIAGYVVSAASIEPHCRLVKEKSIARQAILDGHELIRALTESGGANASQEILEFAGTLSARGSAGLDVGIGMHEAMDAVTGAYAEAKERYASDQKFSGMDCGFPWINKMLNGLMPNRLTVCGARPMTGKTTMAAEMAVHLALKGHRVGWCSLEMSKPDVGGLIARIVGELDPEDFRKGKLDEAGLERLDQAQRDIRSLAITIFCQVPATIDQVIGSMEHLEARSHVDFWVIDYLQRIAMQRGDEAEIGTCCRQITDFKLRHHTHALLLSQLSRKTEERPDHRPRIGDMRGSGQIEQEADHLFLLHRPAIYEDVVRAIQKKVDSGNKDRSALDNLHRHVEIVIAKNRFGPVGAKADKITWVPERAYFTELAKTTRSTLPSPREFNNAG